MILATSDKEVPPTASVPSACHDGVLTLGRRGISFRGRAVTEPLCGICAQ